MTELEKIKRAKMYMDKLANGINPIDDTTAPEEDIINNVRLSRYFFYVSDVLRQVIDAGGAMSVSVPKEPNPKKTPFLSLMKKERLSIFQRSPYLQVSLRQD